MSSINKLLLALVALVVVATYAAAQTATCTVVQCADCVAGSPTQCAECNPGYQLNAKGRCVTNVNAAAAPQGVAAVCAALVAAAMSYVL